MKWKEKDNYIERQVFLNYAEALKQMKQNYYYKEPGKEKDFEDRIVECICELCYGLGLPPLEKLYRQKEYHIDDFKIRPDLIVHHTDNSITVFEIKKANEKYPSTATTNQMNAVGQLLLYKSILSSIHKDKKIRVALIDNKIYKRTFFAFAQVKLPITLIEVQNDRVFVPYYAWGGELGR